MWRPWIAVIAGLVLGFSAATAIHSMLDAMVRSATKRTAADCVTISTALERYRDDHGQYPPLDGNIDHLSRYLVPAYLRGLPTHSTATGERFLVFMSGPQACVLAPGKYAVVVKGGFK